MTISEAELRQRFPWINWSTPVAIVSSETGERRFACRYCISQYGLKGSDQEGLWETEDEVLDHISQFHPNDSGIPEQRKENR